MLAPFRGIRYARDRVSGIANVTSPPYDVINGEILGRLRAADPHNVVRLILPGWDADANPAAPAAEANRVAAGLLREWLSAGVLIRDRMAALYIYEQRLPGSDSCLLQRGIIGLVRLGSPESAGILPHENVMPGLVAGRRELMAATQANLEPIFLIYDGGQFPGATDTAEMATATQVMDRVADDRAPLVSITTEDGISHRLWRLGDPGEQAAIAADLSGRRALIADGHHRYAAYLQLQAEMRASGLGSGPWDYGLAFLVDSAAYPPRLGAIHRVLPGLPPDRAAELAKAAFTVQDLPAGLGFAARWTCWPRPGGRDPRSCWPAARCSACSASPTRFFLPPRCHPVPRRRGRTSPLRSCSSCCSAGCGASPTASRTCSSTTTRPTRSGRCRATRPRRTSPSGEQALPRPPGAPR